MVPNLGKNPIFCSFQMSKKRKGLLVELDETTTEKCLFCDKTNE